MSESPIVRLIDDPELSSAIREHLEAVIDEPVPPPAAFDEAGQHLADAIAAEGAKTSGLVLKVLVVLGVAGGAAAAVVLSQNPEPEPEPEQVAVVEPEPAPEPEPEPPSIAEPSRSPGLEPAAQPEPEPEPEPAAEAEPEPEPEPPPPSEIALVGRARSQLARSPAKALASLQRCARLYPDGMLAMERDALTVEALFALGRTDAAVRKGNRFIQRYPKGTPTRHIRELVEEASTSP